MRELPTGAGKALSGMPWNAYPRPRLVRPDWLCLNGPWRYTAGDVSGEILVPFCPESLLSGIGNSPAGGVRMEYRRTFSVPDSWRNRRVLLHFGAVSRTADVRVNGSPAVRSENGYLPFSADVTDLLRPGENELAVYAVNDLSPDHPLGKQKMNRGGMWYTPVSGIWQTVWLEPVPENRIRSLSVTCGTDWAEIRAEGAEDGVLTLDGRDYPLRDGRVRLSFDAPHPWSPEDPFLYRFALASGEDRVESYFALRTVSVRRSGGLPRICLNGKPYFFHGLLDQGYWSDGLYTPADPEAFKRDILAMKALGFNTLRKHIKIEPERFYYECDRLGMIVFQDMVSCGEYSFLRDTLLPTAGFIRRNDSRLHRNPALRENFLSAMDATVRLLGNHPCVCLWTIFNEGWGQFLADRAYDRLKSLDGSRPVDSASGWFRPKKTDVESLHIYFQKLHAGKTGLPLLLSEIGGWSLKIPEHSFNQEKTYGYRKYTDRETFLRDLRGLYLNQVLPLIRRGLCGTVYTQVSDVEDETNGLFTFDREVLKIAPEEFSDIAAALRREMESCR